MWFIVLLLIYLGFFKKILKNKTIEFDSENIYFEENIIPLQKITEIGNGKIYYEDNGENKKVYFDYNYYNQNLKILKNFYKEII